MSGNVLSIRTKKVCESCGAKARITLADGSSWCGPCDAAAIRLGYDDEGRVTDPAEGTD